MKIFAEVFYTSVIRIFHGASTLFSLIWTKFLNFLNDFYLHFLTFIVIIISYWFYLTRSLDLYTLIIAFWLWSVIFVSYKKYIPRLRFHAYICMHIFVFICMNTFIWNFQNSKSIITESRLVVAMRWKAELERGVTDNHSRIPFWGDENVLEFDSGDGCTTLSIHMKINILYTSK